MTLLYAPLLFAQVPANDSCQNATPILLDEVLEFSTIEATTDGPEHPDVDCFPIGTDSIHKDVWFIFEATFTGQALFTNCGTADFDSRMAVYVPGAVCPVTHEDLLVCNDDGNDPSCDDFFTSELLFDVTTGASYLIRVGGYSEDGIVFENGSGTVTISEFIAPDGPDNDACEDAIPVSLGAGQAFTTTGALTDGPDHPDNPCFGFGSLTADNDIWYTFTPDFTGTVEWSTCDMINFDSRLAVYNPGAACPFLDEDLYACNDDGSGCPAFSSLLIFDVEAGETYTLRLGGFSGDSGFGSFSLIEIVPPVPPANDSCINAEPVEIISREVADDFEVFYEGSTLNGSFDTELFDFPVCLANQNGGEFSTIWYTFNNLGNTEVELRFNPTTEEAEFYVDLYEACQVMADTSVILSTCFESTLEAPFILDTIGILPDVPTQYYLRITTRLTNQIPGEFFFQLVGDITSSVQETALSSFAYYPNPASSSIETSFSLKENAHIDIQVLNPFGQQISAQSLGQLGAGSHRVPIDITQLPPGLYLLNMVINDQFKTVKFVKK